MKRSLLLTLGLSALYVGGAMGQADVPDLPFRSTPDFLKLPDDIYLGEVAGVATNSQGNIFVYTRTGTVSVSTGVAIALDIGPAEGSSRLFEFDPTGAFVREIAPGLYGFTVAHAVRVDGEDNIWVVDSGANIVIKLSPEGRVLMSLGRKPYSKPVRPEAEIKKGAGAGTPTDEFEGPTDVAFDSAGNVFVADGHENARVAKFDRKGVFLKSWGRRGSGPGEFDTPHSIAVDGDGNVYVADHGNSRIQVFDNDGEFKREIKGVGAPSAVCISPGSPQYLFSSNSNDPRSLDNGEIYKLELNGRILGRFGRAGKLLKEFGVTNAIDCRSPTELYVGEITNWRVQKLVLSEK